MNNVTVIIPARIGSTRFPEKPLALIAGVPMVRRVIEAARAAVGLTDARLVVATDDERIAAEAHKAEIEAIMTPSEAPSGSDRALLAAQMMGLGKETRALIINLQGDAPFTPPAHIEKVIAALQNGADVATPVAQLDWAGLDTLREQKEERPFSGTTCLMAGDGAALWFSKSILPMIRDEQKKRDAGEPCPVFRHIGLYGYTFDTLEKFSKLPVGRYEALEGLEQLRFLENGVAVQTVLVDAPAISMAGIDAPGDVAIAERLIDAHGDPYFEQLEGRTRRDG